MNSGNAHLQRNATAWNRMAERGSQFARVATDGECRNPLRTLDSRGWLPASVEGMDVLCLAAGGGWQSILYASAGANVTVVDISRSMLNRDHTEAGRRGLTLRMIEGSMDDLSMLSESRFDIVHQPVSTCYVRDVGPVFAEIARVLRDGGLYVSQHKQPTSLQVTQRTEREQYVVGIEYFHRGPLPETEDGAYRESGMVEFLHRWDDLVGKLCRSGFAIEDLREPRRADRTAAPGHFGHRGLYIPPYVRLKARRLPRAPADNSPSTTLWIP